MWLVHVQGVWHQVADDAALADLARRGIVSAETPVRQESWPEATALGAVPAFAPLFARGPVGGAGIAAPAAALPLWARVAIGGMALVMLTGGVLFVRAKAHEQNAACDSAINAASEAIKRGDGSAPGDIATAKGLCRSSGRDYALSQLDADLAARRATPPPTAAAAPPPGVGARVVLVSPEGSPISASRRPERWGDEDVITKLAPGTGVVVLERREYPTPDRAFVTVRYRVEFASAGRKVNGWIPGWAVPGEGTAGATTAAAATSTKELPTGAVALKANYVAATTEAQLDQAHRLVAAGDRAAFDAFVRTTPGVFLTIDGTAVSVTDAGLSRSRVRRAGTLQEFWVDNEALRRP